jgi:lipopolysaccharide transport system ATP-binding protein
VYAPIVEARSLSKVYKVYGSPWDRFREAITRTPRHREFHALEGVSFSLAQGEGLAILGENGAGKSTLLKILAGITTPTSGQLQVRGKIASILELGAGFHPEFTGRQNAVLNAAMLGLSDAEVKEKMPEILAFSELGDFIDQPVKCYSTGMAMRLGFAIATQVDPEVLIIDEALSVGDGYFQKKCFDRLRRFVEGGGTLLFCSHAMYYVSAFCRRALWLRNGRPVALGGVDEVVRDYESFLLTKATTTAAAAVPGAEAEPSGPRPGPARFVAAEIDRQVYRPDDPWELAVAWESESRERGFHLGVGINRIDGVEVCSFATHLDGLPAMSGERRYEARLALPRLPLVKGEFSLYVFLLDDEGLHIYDQRVLERAFSVESPGYSFGLVRAEHHWKLDRKAEGKLDGGGLNGAPAIPVEEYDLAHAGRMTGAAERP